MTLLFPLLSLTAIAEDAQRTQVPATANVESRTYQQDGRKVTERVVTTTVREVEATKPKTYKAAIFLSNNAHSDGADQLNALEDMVVAGVTEQGLQVISRTTALNAVEKLDAAGVQNKLDDELSKNTSAVRLAQNLGADVLLHVTITSLDTKTNRVDAYGVK
jgi:hypothetical protein